MTRLSRRRFLVLAGASALAVPACGKAGREAISPSDPAIRAREAERGLAGATVHHYALTAGPVEIDLAGRKVDTWGYRGPRLSATAGDVLEVALHNDLPEDTTIHWHGIALRNDMDGVHDLTQNLVGAGKGFTYRFVVPHPGTFFFHPHVGLQLERALYAPLIVDDPNERGDYDADYVLVLDDWLDTSPEETFATLAKGMPSDEDMEGMDHGDMDMGNESSGSPMAMGESDLLGGHAGDVTYATHLINGRPPEDRPTFKVPGTGRVRLRFINASSDTAYRVAVGGHQLLVTHADGFPIQPITADAILLGMGERYDVLVDAQRGAHPIVAVAEGKAQQAEAVLRRGAGKAPARGARPRELDRAVLRYSNLIATEPVRLRRRPAETNVSLELTGDHANYRWGINDKPFRELDPIEVEEGQRVRLVLRNKSNMWHPMHLHGHTFALERGGARKDTVIVRPGEDVAFVFDADNPGRWMLHCHNTYHLEAGMAAQLSYVQ